MCAFCFQNQILNNFYTEVGFLHCDKVRFTILINNGPNKWPLYNSLFLIQIFFPVRSRFTVKGSVDGSPNWRADVWSNKKHYHEMQHKMLMWLFFFFLTCSRFFSILVVETSFHTFIQNIRKQLASGKKGLSRHQYCLMSTWLAAVWISVPHFVYSAPFGDILLPIKMKKVEQTPNIALLKSQMKRPRYQQCCNFKFSYSYWEKDIPMRKKKVFQHQAFQYKMTARRTFSYELII